MTAVGREHAAPPAEAPVAAFPLHLEELDCLAVPVLHDGQGQPAFGTRREIEAVRTELRRRRPGTGRIAPALRARPLCIAAAEEHPALVIRQDEQADAPGPRVALGTVLAGQDRRCAGKRCEILGVLETADRTRRTAGLAADDRIQRPRHPSGPGERRAQRGPDHQQLPARHVASPLRPPAGSIDAARPR